jgi:urease accessory protein
MLKLGIHTVILLMTTTINIAVILTSMITKVADNKLLALLHLSSSALPVGTFAYSQGLEFALDSGWCTTSDEVASWIEANLEFGLGQLDLPIYLRIYQTWLDSDWQNLEHWNDTLLAFRETKELYLEDTQIGGAFAQWHRGQDQSREQYLSYCPQPTVVAMHSLAAVISDIEAGAALQGFAWSWIENQIICASKAMPMGQSDGQRILQALIPKIGEVCQYAMTINDDDIGTSLIGTAIASSLHEQQYSRLFRS